MNFLEKYFWIFSIFLVPLLYFVVATIFYLVLFIGKKDKFKERKIQKDDIANSQLLREYRNGFISLAIFAAMGFIVFLLYHFGYSRIYLDVWKYGVVYLIVSAVLLILFHDMYFYWTHRLFHLPGWYQKIHRVHHLSSNPTPFTALAFHPVESIIQAAVLPLIILIIPVHPFPIFFFISYMVFINVAGHSGFEFSTAAFRQKRWNRHQNYSIHHNLHHLKGKMNYGLYFTIWDRLMNTFEEEHTG